jgi:hypothetical protein
MNKLFFSLVFTCFLTPLWASDPTPDAAAAREPVLLRKIFPSFPTSPPSHIGETQIFPDDAKIPLPRFYEPLIQLLQNVQTPGLTFQQAKTMIEEHQQLIASLYQWPDLSLKEHKKKAVQFFAIMGAGSLDKACEVSAAISRAEADAAPDPSQTLFPVNWQFVTCYGRTFQEEENRVKSLEKSPEEVAESKKLFTEQKLFLRPFYSCGLKLAFIGGCLRDRFSQTDSISRYSHSDFFQMLIGSVKEMLYYCRVTAENPCPPPIRLGVHKLSFMIYMNFLLTDLYHLYHIYMDGSMRTDRFEKFFATFETDYPKPFQEVCDRAFRGTHVFFRELGWNIFHHVNAMIPHIVYVDDETMWPEPTTAASHDGRK